MNELTGDGERRAEYRIRLFYCTRGKLSSIGVIMMIASGVGSEPSEDRVFLLTGIPVISAAIVTCL